MRNLPSGAVTLVFTDIESSTRLLRELGPDYGAALAEQRRVVRESFSSRRGVEVDTQGDSFFYAFSDARDAVEAVRAAQAALGLGPIRVRMGVHTGSPEVTDEGYVGLDVHLAARVAAAGHGGQVLLTRSTQNKVGDVGFRDLGQHHIKDFDEPVWLFQLGARDFPPLRTIANTNLPRPAGTFVGRAGEPSAVAALVMRSRLVTLTGPGGSGKTRLAVEAAAELVGEFIHGVIWVELAAIREPGLVIPAVGQAMGYNADLAKEIGDKQILLLLDNMEQVVDAAASVAELVEACPNLRILVTSRERMNVRGEVEYEVGPMASPDAVELFCFRGRVPPSRAVEELCRRLDYMPLAVELAAARTRVLSPAQILDRLGQRLDLFRSGRDADPRHTSLRATVEWSYSLLDQADRDVFDRLAVFAGGCTLDAAEDVCEADIDRVQSLVDKSLLRHTTDRFEMLETIREYAAERLAARPDAELTRTRHARWMVEFAQSLDVRNDDQDQVFSRLRAELPNVRVAVDELNVSGETVERLRLAATLARSMFQLGATNESRLWLEDALNACEDCPADLRALGFAEASMDSTFGGDPDQGLRFATKAAELAAGEGDTAVRSDIYLAVGIAEIGRSNFEEAEYATRQALEIAESLGDASRIGDLRNNLAYIGLASGNLELARDAAEAALPEALRLRSYHLASTLQHNLSLVAISSDAPREAVGPLLGALRLAANHRLESIMCACVETTGAIASWDGDHRLAATLLGASGSLLRSALPVQDGLRLKTTSEVKDALGSREFAELTAKGAELSVAEAASLAMAWLTAKADTRGPVS